MQSFTYTEPAALESAACNDGANRFSLPGIAAAGVGTLLAVSLIPEHPAPQGALFSSALVMAVGLAMAPMAAAFRDPKALLRTEHVVVLAPIYWLLLDLLQGAYSLDGIHWEQVETAFIGIGLFVVAVWVGASGRVWKVPRSILKSVSQDFSPNTFLGLSVAAFVLGMLPFAIPTNFDVTEMLHYVGTGRWEAPWARGRLGGWDAFLDQLQYFGYVLPTLTVVVAHRSGWGNGRTLLCGGMAVIMVIFLAQSGSRRVIGVIFGMAFIIWVLTQQRLWTKHMLIAAAAAAALLVTLEIMLEYRNVGLAAVTQTEENQSIFKRDYLHVDDNFYRLCQVIELIPEYYPHTYHKYFVWVLVRPIPRVFWPGKPVDPGFDLPSALGAKGVSLSTTVIGELYVAAGFIGIALGGWFYGRLSGMANQLLTQRTNFSALIIYATLTMSLFSGVRSMLELVLVNYAMLAWIGLSRVIICLRGQNNS